MGLNKILSSEFLMLDFTLKTKNLELILITILFKTNNPKFKIITVNSVILIN
jgi:hypothetical protein